MCRSFSNVSLEHSSIVMLTNAFRLLVFIQRYQRDNINNHAVLRNTYYMCDWLPYIVKIARLSLDADEANYQSQLLYYEQASGRRKSKTKAPERVEPYGYVRDMLGCSIEDINDVMLVMKPLMCK